MSGKKRQTKARRLLPRTVSLAAGLGHRVTAWMPAHTTPIRSGRYERDWTNTDILPVEDRRVTMDYFIRVPNPNDSLYPGVWYVLPDFDDASQQHLPWRGIARPPTRLNWPGAASSRTVPSHDGLGGADLRRKT